MKQKALCPLCRCGQTLLFLDRPAVPVHQNRLFDSAAAAQATPRGDLAMRLCPQCGFAFNACFRPELLDYGHDYDNTQDWSAAFTAHVNGLVRELVEVERVRDCQVVEVGCGKGAFLRKLVAYPGGGNVGLGIDSSYVGPRTDLDGRVQFVAAPFDGRATVQADAVVCRHVIEHIAEPLPFLHSVRTGLPGNPRVFFETPCLAWALENQVFWDFFYEHCSLFTAASLTEALERAGFGDVAVRHVFEGQYLWLRGRAGGAASGAGAAPSLVPQARDFPAQERARVRAWQVLVQRPPRPGPVGVWGAGAKGVTFCNLVDPRSEYLACVIDVNPAKQGRHIAGTGHRILGPEGACLERLATVLVLNPNYLDEVRGQLVQMGSPALVVNALQEEDQQACA